MKPAACYQVEAITSSGINMTLINRMLRHVDSGDRKVGLQLATDPFIPDPGTVLIVIMHTFA